MLLLLLLPTMELGLQPFSLQQSTPPLSNLFICPWGLLESLGPLVRPRSGEVTRDGTAFLEAHRCKP